MKVITFKNTDEMFTYLEAEKALEAAASNEEWTSRFENGTKFFHVFYGLVIWGAIEDSPYPEDNENMEPHIRLARCYSTACPEGELGLVNLNNVEGIVTEEVFNKAKEAGWDAR